LKILPGQRLAIFRLSVSIALARPKTSAKMAVNRIFRLFVSNAYPISHAAEHRRFATVALSLMDNKPMLPTKVDCQQRRLAR
jgi:hypothetical protein